MASTGSRTRSAGMMPNDRLFVLYSQIVGGTDFLRTQAGPAELCRQAMKRAHVALKVYDAAQEQEGGGDE